MYECVLKYSKLSIGNTGYLYNGCSIRKWPGRPEFNPR